jgi:hypothetical protein
LIQTEGVTKQDPVKSVENDYVTYENKLYKSAALQQLKPELFTNRVKTTFGDKFPKFATRGQMFVRVDVLPNRVFKFDSNRWIEINKQQTDSYLDDSYVKFLIDKIETGEIDIDTLTDEEKARISEYLTNK